MHDKNSHRKNIASLLFVEYTNAMKLFFALLLIVILLGGCSDQPDNRPVLLGSQHMRCDRLFDPSNNETTTLKTPAGFYLSPLEAFLLAESKAGFKCGHKFGSQIYADKKKYYIVRLSGRPRLDVQQKIIFIEAIIYGVGGDVWEVKKRI